MRCGDSLLLYLLVQVTSGLYGAEWGYTYLISVSRLNIRFALEKNQDLTYDFEFL